MVGMGRFEPEMKDRGEKGCSLQGPRLHSTMRRSWRSGSLPIRGGPGHLVPQRVIRYAGAWPHEE